MRKRWSGSVPQRVQVNWVRSKALALPNHPSRSNRHASTQVTPFFANFGYHPKSIEGDVGNINVSAESLTSELMTVHKFLKSNLEKAISTYKAQADEKRRDTPIFQENDLVMLKASDLVLPLKCQKIERSIPFSTSPSCSNLKVWRPHPTNHFFPRTQVNKNTK